MKVRFFTADSIQEAMAQVKNVLGRDAIILHTRTFRKGGILGFFAKEKVEIMAAIDTPVTSAAAKVTQPPLTTSAALEPAITTVVEKKTPSPYPTNDKNLAAVQTELATMRNLLEQVLDKEPPSVKNSAMLDLLLKSDIDMLCAEQIIKDLSIENINDEKVSHECIKMIAEQIKRKIHSIEGIEVPMNGRKIVAFIGPTGVGKTTTIAKLAAKFAIQNKNSVVLITADTYRVSAVEQLKTYSDIMGIPIHIVYTPNELKRVLDSNMDKELILIDTAGRSPHNTDQLEELKHLLHIDETIEKHLVLSSTTRYKDALDIVEKFSICSPFKVIFTKLDEARNIGTIINLLYKIPITLSYVTNGQNVPDDIELVDPQKLGQLIFRDL